MPVTILEIAEYRLGRDARTAADFAKAGVAIMGGCERCGASIAAYHAYPSRPGFWRCEDCIGDDGWDKIEDAVREIFGRTDVPVANDSGCGNGGGERV